MLIMERLLKSQRSGLNRRPLHSARWGRGRERRVSLYAMSAKLGVEARKSRLIRPETQTKTPTKTGTDSPSPARLPGDAAGGG